MRRCTFVLAGWIPSLLAAQAQPPSSGVRIQGGLSGVYFKPAAQLATITGRSAGGYGAHFLVSAGSGAVALRVDYRRMIYGSQDFARSYYDRRAKEQVDVDSSVTNNIRNFVVGPQLILPFGPIRPYVGLGIGFSIASTEWDVTESRPSDNASCGDSDSACASLPWGMLPNIGQIVRGDWTSSVTRTIGVVVPLTAWSRRVSLDVGLTENRSGRATLRRQRSSDLRASALSFRTVQVGIMIR